jgi:hypothetical protein
MADESKTSPAGDSPPKSDAPKSVELVDVVVGEQKTFSERGLQVVNVNVTPESQRPTGGGDIPPPTNAAPSGRADQSGQAAPQQQSQPSE